jgi:SAM-dependent methyltransferase
LKASPNAAYVDLGCCFGQDLRQLVFDGIPSEQLVGVDIDPRLPEFGYDLFRDRASLKSWFLEADIFADGLVWQQLEQGEVSIVHCSAFLHLWTWDKQVQAAKRIVKMVKVGGMVVGRQLGTTNPGERPGNTSGHSRMFRHDTETFKKLWQQIGDETGTKWEVEVTMDTVGYDTVQEDDTWRRLLFCITRVA